MARYTILRSEDIRWIWDSKKHQMFREVDGLAEHILGNLQKLEKFEPFAYIEKQTDTRPLSISFNERDIKNKKLGKKVAAYKP